VAKLKRSPSIRIGNRIELERRAAGFYLEELALFLIDQADPDVLFRIGVMKVVFFGQDRVQRSVQSPGNVQQFWKELLRGIRNLDCHWNFICQAQPVEQINLFTGLHVQSLGNLRAGR